MHANVYGVRLSVALGLCLGTPGALAQSSDAAANVDWVEDSLAPAGELVSRGTEKLCVAKFAFEHERAHAQRSLLRLPGTRFTLVSVGHCTGCEVQPPLESRVSVVLNRVDWVERIPAPLSVSHAPENRFSQWITWLAGGGPAAELGAALPDSFTTLLAGPNSNAPPFVTLWTRKLRGDHVDHYLVYELNAAGGCARPNILVNARVWDPDLSRVARTYKHAGTIVGAGPELPESGDPIMLNIARRSVRIEYFVQNKPALYCSGLLVDSHSVLTARHCLDDCLAGESTTCESYSMDVGFSITKDRGTPITSAGSFSEPLQVRKEAVERSAAARLDYVVLEAPGTGLGPIEPVPYTPSRGLVGSPAGYLTTYSKGRTFFDQYPSPDGARVLHTCFNERGLSGAPYWEGSGSVTKPVAINVEALRPCLEPSPLQKEWLELEDEASRSRPRPDWYQHYLDLNDQKLCIGRAVSLREIYAKECSTNSVQASRNLCSTLANLLDLQKQGQ